MAETNMTPKGFERQQRILESAKDVFLEFGFDKASVAEIIRRSGGSTSSLYSMFGNKLGVFRAMIEYVINDVFAEFADEHFWTDDIEDSLTRFATKFVAVIGCDDAIRLSRVITGASGDERAEVIKIFFDMGPARTRNTLTSYFVTQQKAGRFDPQLDPYIASAQFVAMLKEPWYSGIEAGVDQDLEQRQRSIRQAIRVFFAGIQPIILRE